MVEIVLRGKSKDLPVLHSQYHGCWWPGDVISSHGINLVVPKYPSLSTSRINVPPHASPPARPFPSLSQHHSLQGTTLTLNYSLQSKVNPKALDQPADIICTLSYVRMLTLAFENPAHFDHKVNNGYQMRGATKGHIKFHKFQDYALFL